MAIAVADSKSFASDELMKIIDGADWTCIVIDLDLSKEGKILAACNRLKFFKPTIVLERTKFGITTRDVVDRLVADGLISATPLLAKLDTSYCPMVGNRILRSSYNAYRLVWL
jgi:hypothetical protein